MKSSLAIGILAILASVRPAFAAPSQPFYLALKSSNNATYDGTILEACDFGSTTVLCARRATTANGTTPNNVFVFLKTSIGEGLAATGHVQWNRTGSSGNTTYYLGFAGQSTSNVVSQQLKTESVPYGGYVAFQDDVLSIPDIYDDTNGATSSFFNPKGYYRWQICDRTLLAGNVPSLSWQLGKYAPENPTCQPITVTRQFI